MGGIPADKFLELSKADKDALRGAYAEAVGLPLERVGWVQKLCQHGSRFFLCTRPETRSFTESTAAANELPR